MPRDGDLKSTSLSSLIVNRDSADSRAVLIPSHCRLGCLAKLITFLADRRDPVFGRLIGECDRDRRERVRFRRPGIQVSLICILVLSVDGPVSAKTSSKEPRQPAQQTDGGTGTMICNPVSTRKEALKTVKMIPGAIVLQGIDEEGVHYVCVPDNSRVGM